MKKKNIFMIPAAAVLAAVALTGCQADMETPDLVIPESTLQANISIADLKTMFDGQTAMVPLKDSVANTPYVIHGRVVSSDATGNIYKSLVIQDETACLAFSLNKDNLWSYYKLGQEIVINMSGLYMGYYRGLQQVGAPGDPYNGAPQLGFMSFDYFKAHAQPNQLPQDSTVYVEQGDQWPSNSMYCIKLDLPLAGLDLIKMQSQLVEIRNVHFVDGGKETYAPYQESISRYLKNADGTDSIAVRNSGYSNFYNDTLPKGNGNVRGILSYYNSDWQLLLRGSEDVMISDKGSKEKPFLVPEMLSPDNSGVSGWMQGVIVGSVKAGVSEVKSNDDVIFGGEAEMDNNLLIAADKDVRDVAECVVVNLPQGSLMRRLANLADHPELVGHTLSVDGKIGNVLGKTGITCSGSYGTFEIEGVTITPPATDFSAVYNGLGEADATCDWTFENVTLGSGITRVWSWKEYQGKHYLNGSAYAGSAHEALAYAISPVIDLSDRLEARVSFQHAARFQTSLRTLCGFAVREEGKTEWTEYAIPVWPSAGGWNFTSSGDIDISAFAGKKVQIAFKYGSTATEADTWEIKNLVVEAR